MAQALDLSQAVRLQKVMSRAAFFTGLTIYLEGIVAFVLATEQSLSPAALMAIVPLLVAQFALIRRPVLALVRERLVYAYRVHLLLASIFLGLLWLGSPSGEGQAIALMMGALVVLPTSWPSIAAMQTAKRLRPQLGSIADLGVLLTCLSFDARQTISAKLRSFGGDRLRWAAPLVIAGLALAATTAALALLMSALGVKTGGGGIAQVSAVVAMWVFYRTVRHAKLRGSELRVRDPRPPVLILRQFEDDTLGTGKLNAGVRPTFEHFFAGELNRIGPTISVGRPGERLQPLGASRDYLVDADWKRAVGTLIEDAKLVVFILGDSESLVWEFRTTLDTHGKDRTLIIVPPLRDRAEVGRRWERFAHATADVLGAGLPRTLPAEPILAVFFAGEDAVLMVNGERTSRRWSAFYQKWPDYRLALRLFECLLRENPTSIRAVEAFVHRQLPITRLSTCPEKV
jgi:hypothetical protein